MERLFAHAPAPAARVARQPALPPGQRAVAGFPRFGAHLHLPPPAVPADPVIEIGGAVTRPFSVPLGDLATLPRQTVTADFHCVAGWSATSLRWEGVPFDTFYRLMIVPSLTANASISHVTFGGSDGYRSIVELADARANDVLIADRLDGHALSPEHGAPARLVSPSQYGFVSTKHLCRIELHTHPPKQKNPAAMRLGRLTIRTPLIHPHPRARVWNEERHPQLPAWAVRPLYRALIRPIAALCARGAPGRGTDA